MKRFSLLIGREWALFRRHRAFPVFLAISILFALFLPLGLKKETPLTRIEAFEEENADLARALDSAQGELSDLDQTLYETGEETLYEKRFELKQKVYYYQTALRWRLPVFSNEFLSQCAAEYALICAELELYTEKNDPDSLEQIARLEQQEAKYGVILEYQDYLKYLDLCRKNTALDPTLSEEEKAARIEIYDLREKLDPHGKGLGIAGERLVSRIALCRQSQYENRDLVYENDYGVPLSNRTRALLEEEITAAKYRLENGLFDTTPANETRIRSYASYLIMLPAITLFVFAGISFAGERKDGTLALLISLSKTKNAVFAAKALFLYLLLFAEMIAIALAESAGVLLFAPDSFLPYVAVIGSHAVPFAFPLYAFGLLLSFSLPIAVILAGECALAVLFRSSTGAAASAMALYLTFGAAKTVSELVFRSSYIVWALPFCHLSAAEYLFPVGQSTLSDSPSPLFSLSYAAILSTAFLLTARDALFRKDL